MTTLKTTKTCTCFNNKDAIAFFTLHFIFLHKKFEVFKPMYLHSINTMDSKPLVPFNPQNVLLTKEVAESFLKKYDVQHHINNIDIYRCAMVHKSYCTRKNENFLEGNVSCPVDCIPLQEESHERLEFLGDSVLGKVVAAYLFERFPDESEGFLTRTRTKLVNGKMLANLCKKVGLTPYILLSIQIEESGGRTMTNILEDTFEAFIGAIFRDLGDDAAYDWITNVIEEHIDLADLIRQNNNYKDMLLKYMQQNMGFVPRFYEKDNEIVNNQKVYQVHLKGQNNEIISIGTGSNKKEAENDAAKKALEQLCVEYVQQFG